MKNASRVTISLIATAFVAAVPALADDVNNSLDLQTKQLILDNARFELVTHSIGDTTPPVSAKQIAQWAALCDQDNEHGISTVVDDQLLHHTGESMLRCQPGATVN